MSLEVVEKLLSANRRRDNAMTDILTANTDSDSDGDS